VGAAEIRLDHFARVAPTPRRHQPAASRTRNFAEVNLALEDSEEAKRCFSCGHCNQCDTCLVYCPEGIIGRQRPKPDATGESRNYAVDLAYCKGCGICVTECPRSGMEMVPT